MPTSPALDVRGLDPDLVLAAVDDFSPLAGEERETGLRVFFASPAERDAARDALSTGGFQADAVDVSDDDWAWRSQQDLMPFTVGRVIVAPPWAPRDQLLPTLALPRSREPQALASSVDSRPRASESEPILVVIQPSMGFGTGHHATTRLCLAALQTLDLRDAFVLDVGTGSGVLAIAAARLGAASATGIDSDPDAIRSARENLALNGDARQVSFEVADFTRAPIPPADVVTANLTGALLVRASATLRRAVRPGGSLMVSGLQAEDRASVRAAFEEMTLVWEDEEDGWVGLLMKRP